LSGNSSGSGEGGPSDVLALPAQVVLDGTTSTLAPLLVAGRPLDDPFTARLKQDPVIAKELQKVGGQVESFTTVAHSINRCAMICEEAQPLPGMCSGNQ
jgi:hypothetical protein